MDPSEMGRDSDLPDPPDPLDPLADLYADLVAVINCDNAAKMSNSRLVSVSLVEYSLQISSIKCISLELNSSLFSMFVCCFFSPCMLLLVIIYDTKKKNELKRSNR